MRPRTDAKPRRSGSMRRHKVKHYEAATIRDYGSLIELTRAQFFQGPEDGAMKLELVIPHHSAPATPTP